MKDPLYEVSNLKSAIVQVNVKENAMDSGKGRTLLLVFPSKDESLSFFVWFFFVVAFVLVWFGFFKRSLNNGNELDRIVNVLIQAKNPPPTSP